MDCTGLCFTSLVSRLTSVVYRLPSHVPTLLSFASLASPPNILGGDGVALLDQVAASIPDGEPLCVFHSFTLNQFSAAARTTFDAVLARIAAQRDVVRIGLEWENRSAPALTLQMISGSGEIELLALCDPHGLWIEWR